MAELLAPALFSSLFSALSRVLNRLQSGQEGQKSMWNLVCSYVELQEWLLAQELLEAMSSMRLPHGLPQSNIQQVLQTVKQQSASAR